MLITMENNHVFSVEEVCVEDLLGAQVRIKDFLEVKPWEPPGIRWRCCALAKKTGWVEAAEVSRMANEP